MCVFQGEHSENLSEITENEEIFGLDDKIIGVGFFFATFPIRFCIRDAFKNVLADFAR